MPIQDETRDFIQQAEQAQQGLLRELWEWLRYNKKWWLAPIVLVLLGVGLLVLAERSNFRLSGS